MRRYTHSAHLLPQPKCSNAYAHSLTCSKCATSLWRYTHPARLLPQPKCQKHMHTASPAPNVPRHCGGTHTLLVCSLSPNAKSIRTQPHLLQICHVIVAVHTSRSFAPSAQMLKAYAHSLTCSKCATSLWRYTRPARLLPQPKHAHSLTCTKCATSLWRYTRPARLLPQPKHAHSLTCSKCATSLWRYTCSVAPPFPLQAKRAPSMMLAWFKASLKMATCLPPMLVSAVRTAMLAA